MKDKEKSRLLLFYNKFYLTIIFNVCLKHFFRIINSFDDILMGLNGMYICTEINGYRMIMEK